MEVPEALTLARRLLDEHGLREWAVGLNRNVRRMGVCRYRHKRIELSEPYVRLNDLDEVTDTIKHEIAHALVGPGRGHGPEWQAMAKKLGCTPRATGDAAMPLGKWRAVCGGCGDHFHRHRRPPRNRRYICIACQVVITFHLAAAS